MTILSEQEKNELIYFMSLQRLEEFEDFLLAQVPMQNRVVKQLYGHENFRMLTPWQRNEVMYKTVLSLIAEATEFLDVASNWKMNKKEHPIDRERALEEYVDVLKFTLNLALYMPFTVDEIRRKFQEKTKIVHERFDREFTTAAAERQVES